MLSSSTCMTDFTEPTHTSQSVSFYVILRTAEHLKALLCFTSKYFSPEQSSSDKDQKLDNRITIKTVAQNGNIKKFSTSP